MDVTSGFLIYLVVFRLSVIVAGAIWVVLASGPRSYTSAEVAPLAGYEPILDIAHWQLTTAFVPSSRGE